MDPEKILPFPDDYKRFGITLSDNLVFVDAPDSERTDSGTLAYYQDLPPVLLSFHLEATIRAVGEGPATVKADGRFYGYDIMYFNVANNTTDGHPFKNFRGDDVFVTFASDKQHYEYGEPVTVSGQFSDYVGKWVAFDSKPIQIDSENRFSTQIDGEIFRGITTDELYLTLDEYSGRGVEQIKITYGTESDPSFEKENGQSSDGGGCLVATAAYGSELAPQVQFLREIRDNTLLSADVGASFMTAFNQFYYSFSPAIADLQRENPMFGDVVRGMIMPAMYALGIMTLADSNSDASILTFGILSIGVIAGIYVAGPCMAIHVIRRMIKTPRESCKKELAGKVKNGMPKNRQAQKHIDDLDP